MREFLKKIDSNLLPVLAGFLLVFIPLWPKRPLADLLYGYNVRLRLDDIVVAFVFGVFLLQIVRRKVKLSLDTVSVGLIAYLIFGLTSMVAAVFLIHTVPLEYLHIAKTFLHWLRRLEYFSLFFILVGSIRSIKVTKAFVVLFFLTLLGVVTYGFGQKYLYWPAFSTMNREFSKGWVLVLSEHARVLSTFGGHYDLAAYLVIALSLGWSFFFGLKQWLYKLALGILIAGAFWLLVLTASRISFIAYLVGLTIVIFLWVFKKGIGWGVSRLLVTVSLSVLIMLSFGDLSDRFLRVLKLDERLSGVRNVLLNPTSSRPKNNVAFLENNAENNTSAVTSRSDQPPTPVRPGDVTGEEEPLLVPVKQLDGTVKLVERPRTYSQCALRYDLSTCIRLEATWPRAMAGFLKNPFLGSGYATLTKARVEDFTEAESTDSDYFRALGETGLLGFVAFFGTISVMIFLAFRSLAGIKDSFLYSLTVGFIGLTVGLLANALLIDIFEASKVAYMFWAVSGLTLGSLYLMKRQIDQDRGGFKIELKSKEVREKISRIVRGDGFWLGLIVVVTLLLRTDKLNAPVADWHSWRQADTSAVTRNYDRQGWVDFLHPTFDDLSSVPSGLPNPSGYRFVEFPLYNAVALMTKKIIPELNIEEAGRFTTALASCLSVVFIFLICRKLISRRVAFLAALSFASIPYSVFYGRTILPDPSMVALSLGGIYFMVKFMTNSKLSFLLAGLLFSSAAVLVKPYAVFLLAPIVYLWLRSFGFSRNRLLILVLFFTLMIVPFLLWRIWVSQFPEGIPASAWLFNGNGIRFKGAFWFWLFADRIGRLMLGYWGLVLLAFGIVRKDQGKFRHFPMVFFISSIAYLFVFATGNVQHDYYQILLLPSLSILVGMGLDFLFFSNASQLPAWRGKLLALTSAVFMLSFGWYFVRDFYNINHPEIVEAGKTLDQIAPIRAKVIAPYNGDTAFLYQTNRQGWPIVENSIGYLISRGATHYVSVNYDDLTSALLKEAATVEEQKELINLNLDPKKYTILREAKDYVIIQLVPDKYLPRN